jgi:hypothetical protein
VVSPTVLYRRSYHIYIFLILFTTQDDVKKPLWTVRVCYFLCGPNRKYLDSAKSGCQNQIPGRSFALLATAHIMRAARKHIYPTHNSLLGRKFEPLDCGNSFFAPSPVIQMAASRILAFLSRTRKKVFIFISSSSSSAAERHQARVRRRRGASRRRPSICFERFLCIVREKRLTYNIFLGSPL